MGALFGVAIFFAVAPALFIWSWMVGGRYEDRARQQELDEEELLRRLEEPKD